MQNCLPQFAGNVKSCFLKKKKKKKKKKENKIINLSSAELARRVAKVIYIVNDGACYVVYFYMNGFPSEFITV